MADLSSIILPYLIVLYGDPIGQTTFDRLLLLLAQYKAPSLLTNRVDNEGTLSQHDSILITYGDQVQEPGNSPLYSLVNFCEDHLSGLISGIHILPFYPSSSDDGFSVVDYRQVDPKLGTWRDISLLGRKFRLMFDAVINHTSVQSAWFKGFLLGDPKYRDYFICVDDNPDLSKVVRPRALPLLTPFDTPSGTRQVWTTFSDDQADLNYHNPDVLLEIIDTLLTYVAQGAEFIRLDAIAYLWKEIGTSCIHLPQTHRIIQIIRAVLDQVAPYVSLITETNVPHKENISYFGDGSNEAQMVYNFALPPLVLHTFITENAQPLSGWVDDLILPSKQVTFFNFLASHDGIGINPVRGILSEMEIDNLVYHTTACGGLVSYKQNSDGSKTPYELNINYFDALKDPFRSESLAMQVERFVASQAVMLSLAGIPGIYFHSLFGSRGWSEGVEQTGRNRTINRQKFCRADLERELDNTSSLRSQVFRRYARLLKAHSASLAFDPYGVQQVLICNDSIFAITRISTVENAKVLCLQNISSRIQSAEVDLEAVFEPTNKTESAKCLITGKHYSLKRKSPLRLNPYQTLWLSKDNDDF
jgi:glucosylglycerate phosphorylase